MILPLDARLKCSATSGLEAGLCGVSEVQTKARRCSPATPAAARARFAAGFSGTTDSLGRVRAQRRGRELPRSGRSSRARRGAARHEDVALRGDVESFWEREVKPFVRDAGGDSRQRERLGAAAAPQGVDVRATPGLQFLRRRLLAARSFPVHAGRPALAPFLLLKPTVSSGCRIPGRSRNRGEGAERPAGRRSA